MKRFLSAICAVCMLLSLFNFSVYAADTSSGTCGDNLTWTLDAEGTLTISGEGEMTEAMSYTLASKVTKCIIGEGVTSICNRAFNSFTKLAEVTLPTTLEHIGDAAFNNTIISSITLPEALISIGKQAFQSTNISEVIIPKNVTEIGHTPFSHRLSHVTVSVSEENPTFSVIDNGLINNTTKTLVGVFKVADGNDRDYTVPDGIEILGESCICSRVGTLTIPASVTAINCTFANVHEGIVVDANNPNYSAEDGILYNKDKTTLIFCPDYYTPSSNNGNFVLPTSVTEIAAKAFYNCTNILSVTLHENLQTIGERAFESCTSLISVELPSSITAISNSMFSGCTALESIHIPAGVTSIGSNAFLNCFALESFTVDANNQSFSADASGVLYNKDKTELILYPYGADMTEYTVHDGTTTIKQYAFLYATTRFTPALKTIILPESVQYVKDFGCNMVHVNKVVFLNTEEIRQSASSQLFNLNYVDTVSGYEGSWIQNFCTEKNINFEVYTPVVCDHVYGDWVIAKASTCETKGSRYKVCTKGCNDTITEELPLASHTYNYNDESRTEVVASTCKEKGYTRYYCQFDCETYKDVALDLADHTYPEEWTERIAATYDKSGVEYRACVYGCGTEETREIPAKKHSFTEEKWEVITPATCIAVGTERTYCTNEACEENCGGYKDREIPKTAHQYSETPTETIAPTCQTGGYDKHTCTTEGCSEYQSRNAVGAVGHDWSDWVYIENSTTNQVRMCRFEDCGERETRKLESATVGGIEASVITTEDESGKKSEIVVEESALTAQIQSSTSDTFELDLSDVSTDEDAAVAVVLPKTSVDAVSSNAQTDRVAVTFDDDTKVTLDSSVLSALPVSESVSLTVNVIRSTDSKAFFTAEPDKKETLDEILADTSESETTILGAINVDLMADDADVHLLNGEATITVPYIVPAEIASSFDEANLAILYIDDTGDYEIIDDVVYDRNAQTITFVTDHFSTFIAIHREAVVTEYEFGSSFWFIYLMLKREFDIEAAAGEGGTITPEGLSKVRFNKSICYDITPDEGYQIEAVIVDGEDVGAVETYEFTKVRKKHTIEVVFTEIP